jgi:hypothetical protein
MDILEILKKSGKDLYPEDLDFFETELATGGNYNAAYQAECRALIKQIRNWQKAPVPTEDPAKAKGKSGGIEMDISKVAPKEANPVMDMPQDQRLFLDITKMRDESSYKTKFKKHIQEADFVDAAFIEKHFAFFKEWELNAILSVKQLGEPFLEKYFGALDHDKIARYQLFSEAFFMKHYAQMDATIVLQHGKNEWRKKENRSKQLDVFLRLKGVKI